MIIYCISQFQSQFPSSSKAGHLIMGSKLSCCFHPKEASAGSDLHTEALRDFPAEVDFPRLIPCHSNVSGQVVRSRLTPPRVIICPPPSPRLLNVGGVEESDFRDSSTLCLWSLDPRWSEAEKGKLEGVLLEIRLRLRRSLHKRICQKQRQQATAPRPK